MLIHKFLKFSAKLLQIDNIQYWNIQYSTDNIEIFSFNNSIFSSMNKLVENINDITIKFSEYQTIENVKKLFGVSTYYKRTILITCIAEILKAFQLISPHSNNDLHNPERKIWQPLETNIYKYCQVQYKFVEILWCAIFYLTTLNVSRKLNKLVLY